MKWNYILCNQCDYIIRCNTVNTWIFHVKVYQEHLACSLLNNLFIFFHKARTQLWQCIRFTFTVRLIKIYNCMTPAQVSIHSYTVFCILENSRVLWGGEGSSDFQSRNKLALLELEWDSIFLVTYYKNVIIHCSVVMYKNIKLV